MDRTAGWNNGNSVEQACNALQDIDFVVSDLPSPGRGSISDKIKATEIEEECESESFRKLMETGICHITSFYAHQPGCCIPSFSSNITPFFASIFSAAADKFIVHRVIRI
ncbi:hypothetical protein ECE50_005410 [Chitinophaga sp. Mgbs1]|uniref:Uncharacterized protein n=1 Tax=Chitinophaga solisilvae TaxID=1233460 RepID=A0A3S1DKW8_9BACT|nr:hypothetical protein [Chitinophaga solisilvae]